MFIFRGLICVQCSHWEVLFGYSVYIEGSYLGTAFTLIGLICVQCSHWEFLFGYIFHIERFYLGRVFTMRGLICVQCSHWEFLFGYIFHIERFYLGTVFTMRCLIWVEFAHWGLAVGQPRSVWLKSVTKGYGYKGTTFGPDVHLKKPRAQLSSPRCVSDHWQRFFCKIRHLLIHHINP